MKNGKHHPVPSEKPAESLAGPITRQQEKTAEVRGAHPPVPNPRQNGPFCIDLISGEPVPIAYYEAGRHIYTGPHHPCSRCLVRPIPQPESLCSYCKAATGPTEAHA